MAKGGGLILIVFFHLCVRVCVASTVATSETKMIIYYMYSYNLPFFSLLPSCRLSKEGTYMPAAGLLLHISCAFALDFFGFWFLSEGRLRANGDCTSFSCCFPQGSGAINRVYRRRMLFFFLLVIWGSRRDESVPAFACCVYVCVCVCLTPDDEMIIVH
jgi:hypothetical protein